jgi:hypothetical protein
MFTEIKLKLRNENIRKEIGYTAMVIWNFKKSLNCKKDLRAAG